MLSQKLSMKESTSRYSEKFAPAESGEQDHRQIGGESGFGVGEFEVALAAARAGQGRAPVMKARALISFEVSIVIAPLYSGDGDVGSLFGGLPSSV